MDYPKDTLGYHRAMSAAVFGEESAATKYLDKKIAESPHGAYEKVVAPESQVVLLLMNLHAKGLKNEPDTPDVPTE
jgi:hypothetical protein